MQAHGDGRTDLLTLELSYDDVGHSPTGIMEAVLGYVPLAFYMRSFLSRIHTGYLLSHFCGFV